jgi:hypothetical protein
MVSKVSGNQRLSGVSRRDGFSGVGIILAIVPNSVPCGDNIRCYDYAVNDKPKTILRILLREPDFSTISGII